MSAAGTLLETFLTLTVVCVVAFVLIAMARRAGVARAFGGVELVGQLSLEPRRAIYLVRLGDKVLVVGASEAGLTKLGELGADELPKGDALPRSFGDVLTRALGAKRAQKGARGAAESDGALAPGEGSPS